MLPLWILISSAVVAWLLCFGIGWAIVAPGLEEANKGSGEAWEPIAFIASFVAPIWLPFYIAVKLGHKIVGS